LQAAERYIRTQTHQEVSMIGVLSQASIVALASIFMGVVPLAMGIVYVIWPSEQRLALMRPLSLATIFAAVSGSTLGLVNVFRGMGVSQSPDFPRIAWIGFAEALVPVFFGFGCLTVAWLCVAVGLWRRP
jgi:hypothetical protein